MVIGYWDTENLSESSSLLILLQYPMAKEISALSGERKNTCIGFGKKTQLFLPEKAEASHPYQCRRVAIWLMGRAGVQEDD